MQERDGALTSPLKHAKRAMTLMELADNNDLENRQNMLEVIVSDLHKAWEQISKDLEETRRKIHKSDHNFTERYWRDPVTDARDYNRIVSADCSCGVKFNTLNKDSREVYEEYQKHFEETYPYADTRSSS